jgi:hypothetical protein
MEHRRVAGRARGQFTRARRQRALVSTGRVGRCADGRRLPCGDRDGYAAILVISWMIVIKTLRKQNWDLGLALSEEATLPAGTPPPAAGQRPPMVPSASRLIALMGLIVFSAFFIGVGFCVIWALCNGQPIDEANKAWTFFASGAAMFLPYGANKFAEAFK